MATGTLDLSTFDINVSDVDDFADLKVISLNDVVLMAETGASSASSSCTSSSCCGSTSCCSVDPNLGK